MALRMGQTAKASELLEHDFQDELASDYAQYFRLALINDPEEERDFAANISSFVPIASFHPDSAEPLTQHRQEMNI